MISKRKKTKLDKRKLIVFLIFAAVVLALPMRYVIDGLIGDLSSMQETDPGTIGYAASGVVTTPDGISVSSGGLRNGVLATDKISDEVKTDAEGDTEAEGITGERDFSKTAASDQRPALKNTVASDTNIEEGQVKTENSGWIDSLSASERMNGGLAVSEPAKSDVGISTAYKYRSEPESQPDVSRETPIGATEENSEDIPARALPPEDIVITISAVGDCTIGYDETTGRQNRFDQVYEANGGDPAYFFKNVADIFEKDDLTIANLETVFTKATKKADKAYRFKGPPEYAEILEKGNIEAVNLANNHMFDYFQRGYEDTLETLNNSTVQYFGYENRLIMEIRGVKVGLAGFHIGGGGWSDKKKAVTEAIEALRAEADLVIVSFHWGIEGNYKPSGDQRTLAHYAIDNGADLVLGHHPHTLQPVEIYNDRVIAYSLGNFCFGGNRNPKDKDTIILQQSFVFDGEKFNLLEAAEPEIIPVSVSSVTDRNDYKPTVAAGDAAARILKKVQP